MLSFGLCGHHVQTLKGKWLDDNIQVVMSGRQG